MAVTYVAAGVSTNGVASVSVGWPTHTTNDIGILVLESSGGVWTDPSGWTLVANSVATGTQLNVYWARATSSAMPSATTGFPIGADHVVARIYVFRGCVTTGSPIVLATTATKNIASTTWSAPSVTTTIANQFLVWAVTRDNDSASILYFSNPINANLVSPTEAAEAGTISGDGGGFTVGYGTKATAGSTGSTSGTTLTSTTNASATFGLVVAPPASYQLDTTVGSLALNSTSTNLLGSFLLNNTFQTYSLASTNLILNFTRAIDAVNSSFNLSGTALDSTFTRRLDLTTQSYLVTGNNLLLAKIYQLDLTSQEYLIDFKSSILSRSYQLDTSVGTYLTGSSIIEFIKYYILDPATGTFNIVYKPLELTKQYPFNLTANSFTIAGIDAELVRQYYINSTIGIYTVNTSELNYFSDRKLIALPLDLTMRLQSNGDFFWYQTTNTIPIVKYKITKRNEWILGRATHMGRRGL